MIYYCKYYKEEVKKTKAVKYCRECKEISIFNKKSFREFLKKTTPK